MGPFECDADDLDAAIELAARVPAGPHGRCGGGAPGGGATAILEHVFRDEWGRVLAGLIGLPGDFDLAEEAAQEAFAAAAEPARPTTGRSSSFTRTPSAASSSGGWPSSEG